MTLTGRSKAANVRKTRRAVLVYQAGIANVFAVDTFSNNPDVRGATQRLLQSDFYGAEQFARGLDAAGVLIASAHCNQAGDVKDRTWTWTLDEAPFSESFHPVYSKGSISELPDDYGLLH